MEKKKKEWKDLNSTEKASGIGCMGILLIIVLSFLGVFGGGAKETNQVAAKSCEQYEVRAKVISKHFLKKHLNYVGSSHIPGYSESSGYFACDEKLFTFRDWVDAANGFGAKKRMTYVQQVAFIGGDWADIANWRELSFSFLDE